MAGVLDIKQASSQVVDLRSDTITKPCESMRKAMMEALVGDDVFGEDPTVRKLEEAVAALVGKEAGLLVPSGTMSNLVALLTHARPGDEVILEADSHIYYYEAGGMASLGGIMPRPIAGKAGIGRWTKDEVREAIRPENIHFPKPVLLCLENTHNRAGGMPITVAETMELAAVARERGLKVHMDGARLFNAAAALGVEAAQLAEPCDTVSICLSKGLGAPVGSVLTGPVEFIKKARRTRKAVGGGMRQAGVIAAAGLVALENIHRLVEDHHKALKLANAMAELGCSVDFNTVKTNIVRFTLPERFTGDSFVEMANRAGILCLAMGPRDIRLVTHLDVNEQQIDRAIEVFQLLLS